ncbi:D-alanine--D-alanine ligase family protein [Cribrihabitans neustonicus]|uniref:D-alanine--D-alanine ligase family protein n=1 Tax=Cribrihabitans neustonicus TaxID=1429085 RepID=UPI003B5BD436
MKPLSITVLHGASGDDPDERDTRDTAIAICTSLNRQGFDARLAHVSGRPVALPWADNDRPGLVFNMVEAIDRDMQRAAEVLPLLEARGIPYTGCSAAAQRATLSKTAQKQLMARHGLPTPASPHSGPELALLGRVIVKSVTEHSSLGMDAQSVVPGASAAAEIARREARFGGAFFAEEYIRGREFNLSLLETAGGVDVLPPAEIQFDGFAPDAPRIVDYAAKWDETAHSYHHTPRRFTFPDSDEPLLARLTALARRAWQVFGLSGYARVDFRVDEDGQPWILEVNTNPCLAPDAGFAAAAAHAGMGYDALIAHLAALPLAAPEKDLSHVPHPQDC